jgi:DNA-binding beta-propeller fold protein YncE
MHYKNSDYRRRANTLRRMAIVVVVFGLGFRTPAFADVLVYATDFGGKTLDSVNLTTNTVTPLVTTPGNPDSLIFDSSGRIIYSEYNTGNVRRYDPSTHTDQLLGFVGGTPQDLLLDPGGNSVLVATANGGGIDRIDLNTLAVTQLTGFSGLSQGLAYLPDGTLYVNALVNNQWVLDQIRPDTGAIIRSSQPSSGHQLDGLTYDPFTGHFFASTWSDGNGFYEISPTTLTSLGFTAGVPNSDGIVSDGNGNIYIAGTGDQHVYQYDSRTSTLTQKTMVAGLDDIAPVSGLGAPPAPTPEPSLVILSLTAFVGLFAFKYRRAAKSFPGQ